MSRRGKFGAVWSNLELKRIGQGIAVSRELEPARCEDARYEFLIPGAQCNIRNR